METTICFLNDKIMVLSGKIKRGNVFITNYKQYELEEGSIINGVITNSYSIIQVLKDIKSDKKLYSKDVKIIIDSSLIYIKKAIYPSVSSAKMNIFVENEFVGLETQEKEMIFDYTVIGLDEKHSKKIDVICYAVEKNLVKSFIDLFAEEKISISSIDISTNCVIKYANSLRTLNNKTYVIANVDNNNISLMLFVDNKYYYSTRARLLAEVGSEEFYQEISSHVSSIVQFNKSQRNGFEIEEIYICGLTEEENSYCNRYISDLEIRNSSTIIFNSIVDYKKRLESVNVTDYFYNIGSLVRK